MTVSPVSATTTTADSAFGLSFQSLLQIILTQLTYQDPLKPLDNFQFVSQLAQFSQLQLSETLNTDVTSLLTSQSASQATGLLGHTVDFSTEDASGGSTSATPVSGVVKAITFSNGQPEVTIQTSDGQTIANLSISNVTQIR